MREASLGASRRWDAAYWYVSFNSFDVIRDVFAQVCHPEHVRAAKMSTLAATVSQTCCRSSWLLS